ncbi:flagellar motor protein [Psychrosphaera aquimarina]|jgi:chemotaxis protein MotA|uniref:Flagellar motor protein n=1 Tax=Psychrosphaera aquimarina TaxID=2044854 RepID=A0ABU3QZG1_9GAMM|nr:flagellar motor protein [Psychrosphaera aquimarina]MDU0112828.1 flagellar motor protein [Psychrosphaera aquimarina]
MDKLAFTGLVIAIAAVFGGYAVEGGGISALFQLPAFIIVFGGTFGAVMLQTPKSDFIHSITLFPLIWKSPTYDFNLYKLKLCKWADIARQKGFLALEHQVHTETDPFVKKALMMLIDGVDKDVLRESLELEAQLESEHKNRAANVYESLGGYSPTIGIIGAVLGLIQAMANINDPLVLGQGIATAFVATIYGVASANLLFIPFGEKLKTQIDEELLYREMIILGLLSTANGENPQNISRKLDAYQREFV